METVTTNYGEVHKFKTMRISNIMVMGWRGALLGMRYPKDSEQLSDSIFDGLNLIELGERDKKLLLQLSEAGATHRKVLRMIHVQCSVLMPLSFWMQYDTYKVATTANSRSRMHRFGKTEITMDNFFEAEPTLLLPITIEHLQKNIAFYKENPTKQNWRKALDCLPLTYLQERLIDLSYETLLSICLLRNTDKLDCEWQFFIKSMKKACPYLTEIVNAVQKKEEKTSDINPTQLEFALLGVTK